MFIMKNEDYSLHAINPSLGRMMAFIDGENLVFRYQEMLKQGLLPDDMYVKHEKDIYVWTRRAIKPGLNTVIRAIYYTYAIGDQNYIHQIEENLKSLIFDQYYPQWKHLQSTLPNNLLPRVFKKQRKAKAKGVDIQLSVDILTNVYQNNLDVVYLATGDGDYLPVVEEILRNGKQLYLASFSNGLNRELKKCADRFIDLDKIFFKSSEKE